MLGAILIFAAASTYAKQRGVPLESLLPTCTCGFNQESAVFEEEDFIDYELLLHKNRTGSTGSNTSFSSSRSSRQY